MEIKFEVDGKKHILRAIRNGYIKTISFIRLESLARHDDIEWVTICTLMPTQEGQHKIEYQFSSLSVSTESVLQSDVS